MSLPAKTPQLPQWIFYLTDAVLLGAAGFIASQSAHPLSHTATLAITICIIAGAIVGLVPLVARYEREKNETLDDRQRALEALALTLNTAAEQISIAASGLHSIAELAQKNLKHAEQLPHKLQEKIAEFNAQLDNAREDDREELEKELADLRASESERLQSASDKIHKAVTDLTKLDTAAQKHLASTAAALAQAQAGTATALNDATTAANHSLATASAEVSRALSSAAVDASRAVAAAQAVALAEIEAKLTAQTTTAVAAIEAALSKPAVIAAPPPIPEPIAATTDEAPTAPVEPPTLAVELSPAPKRPRRPRREEPVATEAPSTPAEPEQKSEIGSAKTEGPAGETPAIPAEPGAAVTTAEAPLAPVVEPNPTSEIKNPKSEEPAPVLSEAMVKLEPIVPPTAEPFTGQTPTVVESNSKSENQIPKFEEPETKPARRRTRKPAAEPGTEPLLGLAADEFSQAAPDEASSISEVVEKVITSDGATRLLVTAYIGIGNRLFVRGEGPGLSWEKGVPLQFVSIGKWRWESAEATAPVACKLYKNDEIECTALGMLILDPGYQQEVSAKF